MTPGNRDDSLVASMKSRKLSAWIISRDFLLALVATCIMTTMLLGGKSQVFLQDGKDVMIAYTAASAALLGLIIAAYSIFASFGQPSYLYILKKSRFYDDTVTQFAWCGVVLIVATTLSFFDLGVISLSASYGGGATIALAKTVFVVSTFFVFYGLFLVGVLITCSLRMVNVLRGEYIEATKGEE